jgi:rubrerythrin
MNCPFKENNDHEEEQDLTVDLQMLREDLAGELQAINQYEQHLENLENEDAIATLEYIVEDEKKHVAVLLKLIERLDPIQAEKFDRPIF